jgi:integrase/recombinase XerD
MKHLTVSNYYEQLERDFKQWLGVLGYAEPTVRSLPVHVRELLHYLERQGLQDIKEVERVHLEAFRAYLEQRGNQTYGGGLSASHINKSIQSIHTFLRYLSQTGIYVLDCSLKRLEEEREERTILILSEIEAMYEASYCQGATLGQRDRAMLAVFYGCGLRKREGTCLDTADIDLQKRTVLVRRGKGNKERYVPIAARHAEDLEEYLREGRKVLQGAATTEALLLNKHGGRLQDFYPGLDWLREKAGIKQRFGLHALRHSIATHLLASGMEIEEISRFLGHSSLASTQVYTHIVRSGHERV